MRSVSRWMVRYLTIAAVALGAPLDTHAQSEQVTLRVADVLGPSHYVVRYLTQPWMDEVVQATNGAVRFEFYPNEQLGKAKDVLALTVSGVADIGYVAPSYVSDKMPLSAVAQLPGGFSTSCSGTRAFWRLAKEGILAEKEFAPNGVRVLAALVQPPYQMFTTKRPIEKLFDLAGMKIRTTGGAMDITMRKLAAVPVRMAGPEVLESLRRGTIDGGVFPPASVMANDWHTAVRYGTVGENFGSFVLTYVISEKRFAQLPPVVREALVDLGEKATMRTCAQVDRDLEEAIKTLEEAGVRMRRLPPEETQAIRNALLPVAAEWAAGLDRRGRPGTAVLDAFRAAVQ